MTLNAAEQSYLTGLSRARLATIAPNGTPQNKPVGFTYNVDLGTIDIRGFGMADSAKFRNITANPDVALVIDDSDEDGADNVRFLEIRGRAESAVEPPEPETYVSPEIIRIHPRRIVSWNIDPDNPGLQVRDVPDRVDADPS